MHAGRDSLHYAPTSVGALMDTEFLRHAAHDVQGGHDAAAQARQRLRPTWRTVLRRAVARLLHR